MYAFVVLHVRVPGETGWTCDSMTDETYETDVIDGTDICVGIAEFSL